MGSEQDPRCPLCGEGMRRVATDSLDGRERWHCPRCQHEESRALGWTLTLWRRASGSGAHDKYREVTFRSRAALRAWMQRHVQVAQVTWFERERRVSAVIGAGGIVP